MEVADKYRIQANLTRLAEDLSPPEVIPLLIQDGILTFDDRARIVNQVKTQIRSCHVHDDRHDENYNAQTKKSNMYSFTSRMFLGLPRFFSICS